MDEDLFTIFSRFGTVTSAEIIRDYKTGDSLCYAFIEFENKEDCERAYFKMDNTLIDDRRIHVDFSQSVSKLWGQFRHGKKNQKNTGGCYKCGATDHYAKDCTGAKDGNKYVVKDENIQRGGHNNQKYDMVFDEDVPESGERKKRKVHEDRPPREDLDKRDSNRGHDRSRYNEEERGHRSRDRSKYEDHGRKERDGRDYRSKERDDGRDRRRDEREERDYRKDSGERDKYKHREGHRHKRDYDERSHRDRGVKDHRR